MAEKRTFIFTADRSSLPLIHHTENTQTACLHLDKHTQTAETHSGNTKPIYRHTHVQHVRLPLTAIVCSVSSDAGPHGLTCICIKLGVALSYTSKRRLVLPMPCVGVIYLVVFTHVVA